VPSIVKRILLVEDDAGAQLLYSNRLTDLGFEVVVSPTGAMGLMEARSRPFDLYLVDIGLGSGIDGYEVCRRLKTIPEIHGVPVVLISGHVKTQEDLHRGYEAGCQSFLVKGDLTLLEDVVRAMLRIKTLQDDLALQNRLLDEHNRRLSAERARAAELEQALTHTAGKIVREPLRPDGMLLVDGEGVVRASDRGARELFGHALEGKHLARLAPDSRLEASVRNARTEPVEALRCELPERPGRAARALVASVHPFVPAPEPVEPTLRLVLLFDPSRARAAAASGAGGLESLRREWAPLIEAARDVYRPEGLVGVSAAVQALRERAERAAHLETPVLITGPVGSGKAFLARVLHFTSLRPGPLVTVACSARDAEQELFGAAERGEQAPERPDGPGAFLQAAGGTLLLRDVERLDLATQARVLEALEQRRIPRAGSAAAERNDVRLVATTNADLGALAKQGRFLPALLRRLSGETLALPALATRLEDVEPLAHHFLARHRRRPDAALAPEVVWVLERHDWPENVRELERAVQSACESARSSEIEVSDLPQALADLHARLVARGERPDATPRARTGLERELDSLLASLDSTVSLLDAYEKGALLHALRLTDGDKLAAARLLKVGKSTFYRKLKYHGIT
jgi:DNA-binding NtrC family response regulator